MVKFWTLLVLLSEDWTMPDADTGCSICWSYRVSTPSMLIQILDTGYWMLGYAVQARNDRCGVQPKPTLQQHRHYPASSIQYRASLTANISIPTLQHSNTPAFQRRAQRHWHYPVSSIQYRASLTAKIGIPAAASSVQHPVSNIATCKRSHITRILRVILHPSYLSQIKP